MAGFSPQGVAVTSGGVRRKRLSPYVDMIRGQYGQATENVLAQRTQDQDKQQREQDLAFRDKQAKFNQQMQYKQYELNKDAKKQAGLMSAIGTGINAVGTGVNLYNAMGGMPGMKKVGSDLWGGLSSGLGALGIRL